MKKRMSDKLWIYTCDRCGNTGVEGAINGWTEAITIKPSLKDSPVRHLCSDCTTFFDEMFNDEVEK